MNVLSRLRLRTKLALLMGLSALALVAATTIAASVLHQRMLDDRIDKLRAVADTVLGLVQALEKEVAAKHLSHEQAVEHMRKAAQVIRFDAGDGYFVMELLEGERREWPSAEGHHRGGIARCAAGCGVVQLRPARGDGAAAESGIHRSIRTMERGVRRQRVYRGPGSGVSHHTAKPCHDRRRYPALYAALRLVGEP